MTRIFNRTSEKQKRQALRRDMPPAERLIWSRLRGRQISGHKFRRQYSVDQYVLDFYCPELRLAVEIDGDSHFREGADTRDEERQRFIESFGIRFLRFRNNEVRENLDGVVCAIESVIQKIIKA